MDPKGKIALVTGAAQGIGLAITRELLREGVKGLAVCDIQEATGLEVVKGLKTEFRNDGIIFIKTDVSKESDIEDAFNKTIQTFGGLDIVINNAGLCNDKKWQYSISVNVNGTIKGTLLALQHMGKDQGGKGGVVVNTGSIAGLGEGANITPIYNATKHAVIGLTRSFGSDYFWQTTGVRVMSICPAYTETGIIPEGDPKSFVITCRDEWMTEFERELEKHKPPQNARHVGEGVIHMIREAKNGTLWISARNEPAYQINIPHYETLRV